jgi:hypothetical protein
VSSRVATYPEALTSILWAGVAALTATESWLARVSGLLALLVLAVAWMIGPRITN